ncbi:hypothetical protein Tco_0941419 [Tanacetum coccineum]|uniref:Uncharacterized protein n=1 Tax=Tanacetum coccineum TaxID=301880 RepID=A0ABQ5DRR1_9ASTR
MWFKLDIPLFDFVDYYSKDQYAVSIKEDTAYPCLHSPKTTEDKAQYAVSRETQYAVFKIWNEYNILEDIKRGPYSKKSSIRRIQLLGYAVTDIAQKDKNESNQTKPSTRMERVREIKTEGVYILNRPTRFHLNGSGHVGNPTCVDWWMDVAHDPRALNDYLGIRQD